MTTSPSQSTTALPFPVPAEVVLPPYSGDDAECVKCSNGEAFTRYRPAIGRHMADRNGVTAPRGPLPERLQRDCQRCDFSWDEALDPAPGVRAATAGDVAHALEHTCRGYAVDLHPDLADHMAGVLLEMLHVHVRPDHPGWKHGPAQLLVPPAAPVPVDAAQVATVPIVVPSGAERPQPPTEQRPVVVAAASPVPLHAMPAAATTYAPGAEA